MSMSKKDYVAVAAIIAEERQTVAIFGPSSKTLAADESCANIAKSLADHFAADNAKFDRARFLAACGVQS